MTSRGGEPIDPWHALIAHRVRYDILVGSDWRIRLGADDRYILKPIMEGELEQVTKNLVSQLRAVTTKGVAPTSDFWWDIPAVLARRAHRYARILEVLS